MINILTSFFVSLFFITSTVYAAKYKVVNVSKGGSISGFVILKGVLPKPERFAIAKNPEVCGTKDRMIEWVEVGSKGGLQNMFVYLHKAKTGKDWSNEEKKRSSLIDQKDCKFDPWLKALPKGSKLTWRNSDPVLHNIHLRELAGVKPDGNYRPFKKTLHNEGQPPGQGYISTEIKTRIKGDFLQINCEAHNFMFTWIFAADNPYYAQTYMDGSYSIENIPPGKYQLRV